jgi:hypothetical protein
VNSTENNMLQLNPSIPKMLFRSSFFWMTRLLVLSLVLGLEDSSAASAYDDHASPDSDYQHHWSLRNAVPSLVTNNSKDTRVGNSGDDIATVVADLVTRMGTLEATVQQQAKIILNLESKLDQVTTGSYHTLHHRSLQTNDECLPELIETIDGDRYCEFKHVVRFENDTIFNQDAFFNQNVEYVVLSPCFILPMLGSVRKKIEKHQCTAFFLTIVPLSVSFGSF